MSGQKISIPASKSLSNRWLILQYLYPDIKIDNLSTAQDTKVLQKALNTIKTSNNTINIGHAGTAMRFLTALLSTIADKTFFLEGSERMHQRPIKILVEALRQLGAEISYIKNEGYPPLKITGKAIQKSRLSIAQNISSQYISALLLIAPTLPNGLEIKLTGLQVSKPYVQMTIDILKSLGIKITQNKHQIKVYPAKNISEKTINIEGDWSSASYFYALTAIGNNNEMILTPFDQNSLQGDQKIAQYFLKLGIETVFLDKHHIKLKKIPLFDKPENITFNLIDTPDLAQTLVVTCLALGVRCKLTGLQTLRIKETDRLTALKTEMNKLGAKVHITKDSFELIDPVISETNVSIDTYDDHRMAMSFAVLQKLYPEIKINQPEVVIKSFPDFWQKFDMI